jgi:hypothetical protein
MLTWVKVAIDARTGPAGVMDGHVFRPVNRAGHVQGEVLSEKVVWQTLRPYAVAASAPKNFYRRQVRHHPFVPSAVTQELAGAVVSFVA